MAHYKVLVTRYNTVRLTKFFTTWKCASCGDKRYWVNGVYVNKKDPNFKKNDKRFGSVAVCDKCCKKAGIYTFDFADDSRCTGFMRLDPRCHV